MNYPSKSQYHDAYASMVKITMRDGDASERELVFLDHLMSRLSLDEREYEFIWQNYMRYPITAPYSYDERIEALYELGKILNADGSIVGSDQNKWLERVARAIGFEPNLIEEITNRALSLTEMEIEFDLFSEQIQSILSK